MRLQNPVSVTKTSGQGFKMGQTHHEHHYGMDCTFTEGSSLSSMLEAAHHMPRAMEIFDLVIKITFVDAHQSWKAPDEGARNGPVNSRLVQSICLIMHHTCDAFRGGLSLICGGPRYAFLSICAVAASIPVHGRSKSPCTAAIIEDALC